MELRIRIPKDPAEEVDRLLENFLAEAEAGATLWPPCWKQTVLNLRIASMANPKLFEADACDGFHYLVACIWRTVCDRCDNDAIKWLHRFAKAWLVREENLPPFLGCDCSDRSDED